MHGGFGQGRRARLIAPAAIAIAVLAAVTLVALQSRAPTHTATATGIPPGQTTTTVARRTLIERAQLDGTLGYSGGLEIYDRLSGTFTWLPAVGAVIKRGQTLFRLDNLPIALMYGAVPVYRALKQGIGDGPDVAELNANLVALGDDPYGAIVADDHFSAATAAAVRRWQKSEGLPQNGEVELGRVVFAPSARRITVVHPVLGQDPPPSSSRKRRPSAKSKRPQKPRRKRKSSKRPSPKAEPAAKAPAAKKPASEAPSGASGAATPELALSTTATRQVVQLQVKATEQQLARVGEAAPVTLPNGDVAHGRISAVGTVASEASEDEKEKGGGGGSPTGGNGENATVSVTLTLARPVAHLDKAPVSVELVKSIRRDVLAVPATALVATAGGGYAIQVLTGARRGELAVTPGMFANGYVEIEGDGLHPGLTVLEPQ